MSDRERFDIWYWSNIGDENKPVIEAAWEAWQASRACIEVELPRAYRDDFKGWVISERGTIDALKAHDIKVKQ